MKNVSIITAIIGSILTTNYASAGTPTLNERQQNQKQRIKQGVKSGELTKKESRRLVRGQKQLNHMELKAKADGIVTKKERVRLQHKASVESAKIASNKHDKQKRKKVKN